MLVSTSNQALAADHPPAAGETRPLQRARLAALPLPGRIHFGLTTPEPLRRLSTGHTELDALLAGGVPRGRISEILGSASSGKTTVLLSCLAAATRRQEVVAYVDIANALSPESAARAGTDLRRFLWVRPPHIKAGFKCAELLLQAGGFTLVALDLGNHPPQRLAANIWPRLLHGAEQSQTAFIVLARACAAGSFAVLSLRLRPQRPRWLNGAWPLFDGLDSRAVLERNKLGIPGEGSVALRMGPMGQMGLEGRMDAEGSDLFCAGT